MFPDDRKRHLTCTQCGQRKRAREWYRSKPEIHAAESARSLKNGRLRAERARARMAEAAMAATRSSK